MGNDVKRFPVGAVLSIAFDRLLCEIDQVYEVCNFLSGDNLYTHQLPRAHRILSPWVLEQLPQLSSWAVEDPKITPRNWQKFVALARQRYGDTLPLTPIPPERWTHIDPIEEIGAMVGDDKVIVVDPGASR